MSKSPYVHVGYTGFDTTMPFSLVINKIGEHVPAHRHDFIEMSMVISGKGTEIINGVEHAMKPGTFSLLLPWHIHEIDGDPNEPLRLYNCIFGIDLISEADGYDKGSKDLIMNQPEAMPFAYFTPSETKRLSSIFEELLKELDNLETWRNLIFKIKIIEILILFDRFRKKHSDHQRDTLFQAAENTNRTAWEVLQYVHMHYNEDISLSRVAEKFHFSESHLTNLIKTVTGLSFVDTLHEIRIRNACAVLSSMDDVPISTISNYVGFSSIKTFYRVFRELKGMSPKQYKTNHYNIVRGENVYSYPSGSGTVWKVIYYIHLNYNEEITIKSASAYFHFSASYINNLIRRHTGQNFTDILNEIRILNACTLLASTNMPICDIAFEVGYNSKETFFRNFKKNRRISPGDYRKMNGSDNLDIKLQIQSKSPE